MAEQQNFTPDPKANLSHQSQEVANLQKENSKASRSLNDSDMAGFPGLDQINAILQNSDSLTNSAN